MNYVGEHDVRYANVYGAVSVNSEAFKLLTNHYTPSEGGIRSRS